MEKNLNIAYLNGAERMIRRSGNGSSNVSLMKEVTYDELKELRDGGKLVAGQMYRMTDYETTTSQEGTRSAGHPFDLILTALDEKTLDEKCSAIHSARDTEGYFANSDLAAWEVWYCLDNDIKRFNWAQFEGTVINIDFTEDDEGFADAYLDGTITYDGKLYYKWNIAIWGEDCYALTESKNISVGYRTIFANIEGGDIVDSFEFGYVTSVEERLGGTGVIYRMIDESQNDISYDFKNIMFVRKVYDGNIDTENGVDTFVYTFNFYRNTKSEDYSILFPSNCRSNCMDYNKQLHNNVFFVNMPYGYFIGNTFYTESMDNTLIGSGSFNSFMAGCYNNELHEDCYNNILNDSCSDNTFGNNCCDNALYGGSNHNSFGRNCCNNILKYECSDNTFGANSNDNLLKRFCNENVFGEECEYNILEEKCLANSFGNYCRRNKLGRGSLQNKFGEYCNNNTLQGFSGTSYCSWNEFGNYCSQFVLENNCSFNKIGNVDEDFYANLITLKSGVSNIKLTATGTPNYSNYAQNYIIFNVKGSSSNPLEINLERNAPYTTHVTKSSNGNIVQYTDLDIYNAINK